MAAILTLASTLAAAQLAPTAEWPKTDFERRSVELREIRSGGPPIELRSGEGYISLAGRDFGKR